MSGICQVDLSNGSLIKRPDVDVEFNPLEPRVKKLKALINLIRIIIIYIVKKSPYLSPHYSDWRQRLIMVQFHTKVTASHTLKVLPMGPKAELSCNEVTFGAGSKVVLDGTPSRDRDVMAGKIEV